MRALTGAARRRHGARSQRQVPRSPQVDEFHMGNDDDFTVHHTEPAQSQRKCPISWAKRDDFMDQITERTAADLAKKRGRRAARPRLVVIGTLRIPKLLLPWERDLIASALAVVANRKPGPEALLRDGDNAEG